VNTVTGYCGTAVSWVDLCNGEQVSEYISMKNEIILVIVMIATETLKTVI
jgi:hypothetical protein